MGTLCGYGSCYVVYVNDTIIHYIPGGAQSAFGQSTSCLTQRLTTLALQRGVQFDVCPLSRDILFPKTAYHPAQLNSKSLRTGQHLPFFAKLCSFLWLNPILQAFFIQPLLYFAAFVQVDYTDTSHLWTDQCASTFQQLEIHQRETWRYFRDTQTSLPNFIGCEVIDWWYTDAKRQDCCIRWTQIVGSRKRWITTVQIIHFCFNL